MASVMTMVASGSGDSAETQDYFQASQALRWIGNGILLPDVFMYTERKE